MKGLDTACHKSKIIFIFHEKGKHNEAISYIIQDNSHLINASLRSMSDDDIYMATFSCQVIQLTSDNSGLFKMVQHNALNATQRSNSEWED